MKHALTISLLLLFSAFSWADSCPSEGAWLQVLGSGGPEVQDQRASTSYLVWLNGKAKVLIDAGGGAALRFGQAQANIKDLDAVLFSHFHVDHSVDFPALIKSSFFESRRDPLPIYGPTGNEFLPSTSEFIQRLFSKSGVWPYLSQFLPNETHFSYALEPHDIEVESEDIRKAFKNEILNISAIKVHHGPLPSLAWRVVVKKYGSVTFSGDMSGQFKLLPKLAKNTDILVAHHAIPEFTQGVGRFLHMPPSIIGKLAQQSHAKKLVLSHRMLRSLGHEKNSIEFIQKNYKSDVMLADDLSCYQIKSY